MFFLIRYQTVVASRRLINFARQFFEVCPFIIAVQQNFPRGIKIIRCQLGVLEEKRICPECASE